MAKKPQINVIGCGVSGMSCAIVLMNAGYEVTILTEKLPGETTSSKAAAIWFPYEVRPQQKANHWSNYSYHRFQEFIGLENSGISMIDLIVIIEKEEDAWWKEALPKSAIRKAKPEEMPPPYSVAYVLNVPLIETQLYLKFLLNKFKKMGGKVLEGKILDPSKFMRDDQILVNCSGLGAAELFNDQSVYPIQGQIVKIDKQAGIPCITAEFGFDEEDEELAYIVPRKDCIVLGGTARKNEISTIPDDDETDAIISRCKIIAPKLENVNIQMVEVGLRPGRSEIRLERVGNVIHNYGHGGGGFTVSWGCAQDVLNLI